MVRADEDFFLEGEEVAPEATIKITGAGEFKSSEIDGKEAFRKLTIPVQLANTDKRLWTINETSRKSMVKAIGKETQAWVNKNVKVKVNEQNVMGTMRKVIFFVEEVK